MLEGRIIKSLSGFYDVKVKNAIITSKAKGRFRLEGSSPLVGDWVEIEQISENMGVIRRILPRKNAFIRPAVANIDAMVYVASGVPPITDPFLIDRVSVIAVNAGCECIICLNKIDMDPADELFTICSGTGFPTVRTSALTGDGIDSLQRLLTGKICAFAGNSGVGKSSLLNAICPSLDLETAAISEKLGRGRHTTRHVELFQLGNGIVAADTPGFASFEVEMVDSIEAEKLQYCFPDFEPFLGSCRFQDCRHLNEPDCAILQAVVEGDLSPSRHNSYRRLYDMIINHKPW